MYTYRNIEDVNPEQYKGFKLCYVDSISRTVFDYPQELKEKYAEIEKQYDNYNDFLQDHPDYRMKDMPNPDFEPGVHDTRLYFTPIPLKDQWGDDWNDAPYEYNAETPYDDHYENDVRTEHEILCINCCIPSYEVKLPRDWGGCNSPFAVEDINAGCVAWVSVWNEKDEPHGKVLTLCAGASVQECIDTIAKIKESNPSYDPTSEDYEIWDRD